MNIADVQIQPIPSEIAKRGAMTTGIAKDIRFEVQIQDVIFTRLQHAQETAIKEAREMLEILLRSRIRRNLGALSSNKVKVIENFVKIHKILQITLPEMY